MAPFSSRLCLWFLNQLWILIFNRYIFVMWDRLNTEFVVLILYITKKSQNHRIFGVGRRSSQTPKTPVQSVTASLSLPLHFPLCFLFLLFLFQLPISWKFIHKTSQLCCGLGIQAQKQCAGWWDHACTGLYSSFLPEISVIAVYHKSSLVTYGFFVWVLWICLFVF